MQFEAVVTYRYEIDPGDYDMLPIDVNAWAEQDRENFWDRGVETFLTLDEVRSITVRPLNMWED